MSTLEEKASYLLGMHTASRHMVNLIQQFDLDPKLMAEGVHDFLTRSEPKEDPNSIQEVMAELESKVNAQVEAAGSDNAETSATYMAETVKQDGITVTDSGLAYEVLEAGEGDKPGAEATVTVHYEGRLIDGTVFDSSHQRGEPATFSLGQVIPGWTEGLQLMSPGAKYRLHIPSDLAYGMNAPPIIGPNQALVFEVELMAVEA
ncbi:MAG: FKBP-type peptidyl-prolyl cis-trans isomerase [Planctomycetota bacterium]|jgi:FKBP-type peptidyl-prolyl cis-trans isomerase|nr:FKBP-type peptidyl-prolyl cis-trans isomerase [Planctomycetota bacterium]